MKRRIAAAVIIILVILVSVISTGGYALKIFNNLPASPVSGLLQAGRRIISFLIMMSLSSIIIAYLIIRQLKVAQRLRESDLKFKTVFDESFQFFAQLDVDGTLININNSALRVIGNSRDEVIGRAFTETPWWTHSDEMRVKIHEAVKEAMEGRSFRMAAEHIGTDGRKIFADFSIKPIFSSEGKISMLVAEGRDITDIHQADRELQKIQNYLTNIIDSMPSMIIGVDSEGIVTQWNRTVRNVTGIDEKTAVGSFLSDLIPEIRPDMKLIMESMETGTAKFIQKRPCMLSPENCYEDITVYPLQESKEKGAVIRIDDVTQFVNMQEMMIQSEKMMSVGGLAAGLAHEINNPLAGMMQTAEVLQRRLGSSEISANLTAAQNAGTTMESISAYMEERRILELLESVRASGVRAAGIVENMLSFVRKSDKAKSMQDIGKLMRLSIQLASTDYYIRKKYDFHSIGITVDSEADLPEILCEGQKLQQVFLNILKNGAQAMSLYSEQLTEEGRFGYKPGFRISLKNAPAEDFLQAGILIEIEDNGPGMSDEVRKRIFEPFFTTKPIGEGTGLGLSVSYFIITETHGGSLRVESSAGKGARFIIRLPCGY